MIRILIADDHPVVRQGLASTLTELPDVAVTGEASGGREALERVASGEFDLLILDISMPDMGGLDVLKEVKQRRPDFTVLIFSMHSEDQYVEKALALGASGYLAKDSKPREVRDAVRTVAVGERYVSPRFAHLLGKDFGVNGAEQVT